MSAPSQSPRDYYDILGVVWTATPEEIEAAFRAQARKCHPDVCPEDEQAEARFKQVNEAHEVLGDPEKRRQYDRRQSRRRAARPHSFSTGAWADAKTPAFGPHGEAWPGAAGPEWLSAPLRDLFGAWLGGPFGGPGAGLSYARRETDVDAELRLSPEEAVFGGTFECSLALPEPCPECAGQGGWAAIGCAMCLGQGWIAGARRVVRVQVPPGVSHGAVLRVRGAGRVHHFTGRPGDLYLHVSVKPGSQDEK